MPVAPHPAPAVPSSASAAPNLAPPPGNPRFPLFDSLRAIAALSVFAGHTITGTTAFSGGSNGLFVLATQVAYQGVALFFLISGFLLYRPFLVARRDGRSPGVRNFARRRVLRIVPAYWAALSLFLLLGFVHGVSTGNWWIFYGFGQNYSISTIGQGIGAAWTLCIEITFYAALPVFSLVAARFSRRPLSLRGDVVLLVVLTVVSLIYRAHFSGFLQLATISTLPGTFCWFALGMGLAVASVSGSASIGARSLARLAHRHPALCWGLALAAFVALHEVASAGATLGGPAEAVLQHGLYGLVAFFLLLPAVFGDTEGGLPRRVMRVRLLAWIGLISYAFYLYHTIVIEQLDKLAIDHAISPRYLFVTVLAVPISLACAAASYYLLERPAMRL